MAAHTGVLAALLPDASMAGAGTDVGKPRRGFRVRLI